MPRKSLALAFTCRRGSGLAALSRPAPEREQHACTASPRAASPQVGRISVLERSDCRDHFFRRRDHFHEPPALGGRLLPAVCRCDRRGCWPRHLRPAAPAPSASCGQALASTPAGSVLPRPRGPPHTSRGAICPHEVRGGATGGFEGRECGADRLLLVVEAKAALAGLDAQPADAGHVDVFIFLVPAIRRRRPVKLHSHSHSSSRIVRTRSGDAFKTVSTGARRASRSRGPHQRARKCCCNFSEPGSRPAASLQPRRVGNSAKRAAWSSQCPPRFDRSRADFGSTGTRRKKV